MLKRIFTLTAAAVMLAGCTETPKNMGAAVDRDQNVLTGGPITGTTIQELPQAVKDALQKSAPHAEIASIEKTRNGGHIVYEFTFVESKNDTPDICLRDDGKVVPLPLRANQ